MIDLPPKLLWPPRQLPRLRMIDWPPRLLQRPRQIVWPPRLNSEGRTQLKSEATKTSNRARYESRITFGPMYGSAVYEGGEQCQFEFCKVGMLSSSQPVESWLVLARKFFDSMGNRISSVALNLELVALDTPGKVLANLAVHISLIEC